MKTIFNFLQFSFIALLLSSCATFQTYAPNAVHVPLMEKKGQLEGFVNYGGSQGIDAGACYAVSSKIAIMSNLHWNQQQGYLNHGFTKNDNYKLIEAAPGYFKNITADSAFRFEVYAGLGFGTESREYLHPDHSNFIPLVSKGNLIRGFSQFNIGYASKNVEVGIGARIANVYFPDLHLSGYADFNNGDPVSFKNFSKWYIEPLTNINIGKKNIKLNLQMGFSTYFTEKQRKKHIAQESGIFRFGIQYRFNLLK